MIMLNRSKVMYPIARAHAIDAFGCTTLFVISNVPDLVNSGSLVSAGSTMNGARNPFKLMFGVK